MPKIIEKLEEKLPPSPKGYVYWRDKIIAAGKAGGIIIVGVISNIATVFVDHMQDARGAMGLTAFILAAGVAVYINETKQSKNRDNTRPNQPPALPETEPPNGQTNNNGPGV